MTKIKSFSYDDEDKDKDIETILENTDNASTYIKEAIRFYTQYKNKLEFPKDELIIRLNKQDEVLTQIREILSKGINTNSSSNSIELEDIALINNALNQIDNGEFG